MICRCIFGSRIIGSSNKGYIPFFSQRFSLKASIPFTASLKSLSLSEYLSGRPFDYYKEVEVTLPFSLSQGYGAEEND